MHFCFVSTRRGSQFMTELLSAISAATAAEGHIVGLVFDEFPTHEDDCVYVVIPHEFHAWGNPPGFPDAQQRARTIALCTENPGTEWFEATYELLPHFAAAVSINRSSAAELRRRGIRCEHLQLGYSPQWDRWLRDENVQRDIDVLYLGAADPRRDPLLGGFGRDLWARRCQFLIPPLEPRTGPRPDFLTGTEKYDRLRSAKILLNLHRTTSSALEWMRFLEAICNGCVVVSEPCLDGDPLVAGDHFVSVTVDRMTRAIDELLDDPEQLRLMQARAYDFVRKEMPMKPAAQRLAELAADLPRKPRIVASDLAAPHEVQPTPAAGPPAANLSIPSADTHGRRRLLRGVSNRIPRGRRSGVQVPEQTPAFARAKPRVSVVCVAAHEHEREAIGALASVAASLYGDLEVLILHDRASGRSESALRGFLKERPRLPAVLLYEPAPRGLGHSRNTLAGRARGEYLFTLDAAGGVYPSTLQRLVAALDADPQALFSYPMVAVLDGDQPVELLSSLPWEPERLRCGNWIDAMALIRSAGLRELGGYSTDPRLAGWEDFDLWCRCAEAGGCGAHVPQVLAWHRPNANSTTAQTERDAPAQWALMREHFPRLLALPGTG